MKYFPYFILVIAVGFTAVTIFQAMTREEPGEDEGPLGISGFVAEFRENGLFPESSGMDALGGTVRKEKVHSDEGTHLLEYVYVVSNEEGRASAGDILGSIRKRIDDSNAVSIDWGGSKDTILTGKYKRRNNQGIVRAIASQVSAEKVELYFLAEEKVVE